MSSHRKRRCYSFIFLFGNSVLATFRAVYFENTFFILRSSFLGFLLSEKSKQNVNSVNRPSNSSLCAVVLFPPKTSASVCARSQRSKLARKTKYSIQSTRCHVCRRGASPCLIVSSLLTHEVTDLKRGQSDEAEGRSSSFAPNFLLCDHS